MRYFVILLLIISPARSADQSGTNAADWKNRGLQVQVTNIRVIDGDTFDAELGLPKGQGFYIRVRLADIDAPELRGKCKREKSLASAAKSFVADWLSVPPVKLTVRGRDRYGRLLAAVESGRGDLSRALIEAGLVQVYVPGKKTWCEK